MMNATVDCRDRTQEFMTTLQSLAKASGKQVQPHQINNATLQRSQFNPLMQQNNNSAYNSSAYASGDDEKTSLLPSSSLSLSSHASQLSTQQPHQQMSQFTSAAQTIGSALQGITTKVEQLALLARQQSLFNDSTLEINHLSYVIKSDLQQVDSDITHLHSWLQHQKQQQIQNRSAAATNGGATGVNNPLASESSQAHSLVIVDSLKSQLAGMTKNFATVLQSRTQALKQQNTRRKQFETPAAPGAQSSATSSSASGPGGALRKRAANPFGALLTDTAKQLAADEADEKRQQSTDFESTSTDDNESLQVPQSYMQQQLVEQSNATDAYLQSRSDAVQNIETTIVELGEMYKRLVTIVGMQEEVTVRIDQNMENTLVNMERGHSELLKYFDTVSSNRWLILKIFAVLIVFLVFFMVFVV